MTRYAGETAGWTADAEIYCDEHARRKYGEDEETRAHWRDTPNLRWEDATLDGATDSEGNEVHPIFDYEITRDEPLQWVCCMCHVCLACGVEVSPSPEGACECAWSHPGFHEFVYGSDWDDCAQCRCEWFAHATGLDALLAELSAPMPGQLALEIAA